MGDVIRFPNGRRCDHIAVTKCPAWDDYVIHMVFRSRPKVRVGTHRDHGDAILDAQKLSAEFNMRLFDLTAEGRAA